MAGINRMKASIIIATYNRANLLCETIESIVSNCSAEGIEVIIVNNNSTDDTQNVADKFCREYNFIKTVFEKKQGLSHARNKGIDLAQGDILIFLDDDIEIHKGWLDALIKPFADPDVWCVGGKVLPYGKNSLPDWLPARLKFMMSLCDFGDVEREMIGNEKPPGCNMAVRRRVFEIVGKFDQFLGRKGKKLMGGEEVLLYYKIRSLNKKIIYSPGAIVYHKIDNKMTKQYFLNYAYWLGVSESYIERNHLKFRYFLKFLRSCAYLFLYPFNFVINRIRNVSETDEMSYKFMLLYSLGYLRLW